LIYTARKSCYLLGGNLAQPKLDENSTPDDIGEKTRGTSLLTDAEGLQQDLRSNVIDICQYRFACSTGFLPDESGVCGRVGLIRK